MFRIAGGYASYRAKGTVAVWTGRTRAYIYPLINMQLILEPPYLNSTTAAGWTLELDAASRGREGAPSPSTGDNTCFNPPLCLTLHSPLFCTKPHYVSNISKLRTICYDMQQNVVLLPHSHGPHRAVRWGLKSRCHESNEPQEPNQAAAR